MKPLLMIFFSVFVAELGDKTQVATLLFATDPNISRWAVFGASSAALVVASFLGVVVGGELSRLVGPSTLKSVAGAGFILIGVWMLVARG